ncbi:MAG: toxic anion resistance protein [Defluviitaleaceae bacterium]|nr:toxic anion resistance protein [Defluviitaleaceae bacterium]MCL2836619.1 toxic anion resistance protein [Defluviitaleaceae bacterium]
MADLPELVLGNELDVEVAKIIVEDSGQPHVVPEPQGNNALAMSSLAPEEQALVRDFAAKINVTDQAMVMQYGAAAQNKVAKFSDHVLQNVRSKDLGPAGKILSDLVVEIKSVDSSGEGRGKRGGLAGLFQGGGNVKKSLARMKAGYDRAQVNIDNIVSALEGHKRTLLKDIAVMNDMYENNYTYYKEITMYILAGEEKLKEFRENDIPQQRNIAARDMSDMATQKLNDMVAAADRFEKKLHDLKLTRMISIQMAPQIRMIQNNDALLTEKIQSSINNSIPLWKNQMVIAMGLANSASALAAQKKVSDMTNELLLKNSEMLKTSTLEVAKASEESIVSIDTVRKTNENLISTINEVLDIQKKGQENRAAAETELAKLEQGLKTALFEASTRN